MDDGEIEVFIEIPRGCNPYDDHVPTCWAQVQPIAASRQGLRIETSAPCGGEAAWHSIERVRASAG